MKKLIFMLAAASLLAAGCEIKRDGYGFIVSTQSQGTVIEGQQANWNLNPNIGSPLMVSQPGLQPMGGLVLPR